MSGREPDADDLVQIIEMIRERLNAAACLHGKDHGETPPMMYPEWITCALAAAYRAGELAMQNEASKLVYVEAGRDGARVAKLVRALPVTPEPGA